MKKQSHFAAFTLPFLAQENGRLWRWVSLTGVLTLAILFVGSATLQATPSTVLQLSEYQKQDWQVEDGLPENNVRMIAQRHDGTLLLATASGLVSFDGQRFQILPIDVAGIFESEAVNAILPGVNDELWIGTDGRGVLHHTHSGTVNISESAGLFNERIRMLHMDSSGVLWIATQNGIERFRQGRLETIAGVGMISGDITAPFAEDGYGGMFFLTSSGLFYWRNGVARRYGLQLSASDAVVAIYRDLQQRIWIGTNRAIFQLVARQPVARATSPPQYELVRREPVASPVTVLQSDADGNLWIGTRRDGLFRLNAEGLSGWNSRNGLPDDSIRSLAIDDEKNLWIGLESGGLSRWRKGALAPYGDPEGFHANYAANVLADRRGDLWLGTWGSGLFRRHNGKLIATNPPTMPIHTAIRALAEDRTGDIWVGTWFNGVYRYDGRSFRHYWVGVKSLGNAVSAIVPSVDGGLWVGTYTGVFHFPSGEPDPSNRERLLESKLVTCLLEDRDHSILVGTSTGLYRIRDGKAAAISGLSHPYVLSLTLDSAGYVWAATKGRGLGAVRQNSLIVVPPGAGLPDLAANTAVEDNRGYLWLGTARGIVRVPLAELHAAVDGQRVTVSSVIFDKEDGMRSSECGGISKPTSARLPDGTLWFATTKGFVHTTDVAEQVDLIAPVAAITGWTPIIDPNSADVVPTTSNSHIALEPGHTDLRVFFNAKLLSNPSHLEFRYRLAGYDARWTMTRAHAALYRRLPPGKYRFEVQARSSGDEWPNALASIGVEQAPYIYQTWYFYLVIMALAAASMVYLFRRRVRHIKGRMGIVLEERSRIARECHDSLMAGFAAVSWQLEATAKLFRHSNSQSTPAAESCELARRMVAHCQAEARRIIWDLRDTDDVTDILSHALVRLLSETPAPTTIEATFDLEGDEVSLAPGCVHQLYCIAQEAVSNAIRHADASLIAIQLEYESDALVLTIRDNGRGFQNADHTGALSGHFGISVMEERARKLGGTFRIQSAAGAGTEIEARVQFNAIQQPLNGERHIIRWIGI